MAFDFKFTGLFEQADYGFAGSGFDKTYNNGMFGGWNDTSGFGISAADVPYNPSTFEFGSSATDVYGVNHDQPAHDNGTDSDALSSGDLALSIAVDTLGKGFTRVLASKYQTDSYKTLAGGYETAATSARINQRIAKNNIVNAYKTGEYKAMMVGLQNAQKISQYRANTAARGVQMGSGSAKEIEQAYRFSALQDHLAVDRETMDTVMRSQNEWVRAKMAENTALGNAKAANAMADSVGGFGSLFFGLMSLGGQGYMSYGLKTGGFSINV